MSSHTVSNVMEVLITEMENLKFSAEECLTQLKKTAAEEKKSQNLKYEDELLEQYEKVYDMEEEITRIQQRNVDLMSDCWELMDITEEQDAKISDLEKELQTLRIQLKLQAELDQQSGYSVKEQMLILDNAEFMAMFYANTKNLQVKELMLNYQEINVLENKVPSNRKLSPIPEEQEPQSKILELEEEVDNLRKQLEDATNSIMHLKEKEVMQNKIITEQIDIISGKQCYVQELLDMIEKEKQKNRTMQDTLQMKDETIKELTDELEQLKQKNEQICQRLKTIEVLTETQKKGESRKEPVKEKRKVVRSLSCGQLPPIHSTTKGECREEPRKEKEKVVRSLSCGQLLPIHSTTKGESRKEPVKEKRKVVRSLSCGQLPPIHSTTKGESREEPTKEKRKVVRSLSCGQLPPIHSTTKSESTEEPTKKKRKVVRSLSCGQLPPIHSTTKGESTEEPPKEKRKVVRSLSCGQLPPIHSTTKGESREEHRKEKENVHEPLLRCRTTTQSNERASAYLKVRVKDILPTFTPVHPGQRQIQIVLDLEEAPVVHSLSSGQPPPIHSTKKGESREEQKKDKGNVVYSASCEFITRPPIHRTRMSW